MPSCQPRCWPSRDSERRYVPSRTSSTNSPRSSVSAVATARPLASEMASTWMPAVLEWRGSRIVPSILGQSRWNRTSRLVPRMELDTSLASSWVRTIRPFGPYQPR